MDKNKSTSAVLNDFLIKNKGFNMEPTRENWKSRTGFLMAAIGSAIGLGNIWRFNYLAYKNGGATFLIPYLVALLTAGLPILILEFGIGHKMRASAPESMRKVNSQWEWLGWWPVLFVMFGIVLYGFLGKTYKRT